MKRATMRSCVKILPAAIIMGAMATSAFAHPDPAAHGSFASGFSHPLFGLDHVLAMIGVGLWAALLGRRAIWLVPTAFVVTMMLGFAAAMANIGLPFVEPAIVVSVVVLGLLALAALRAPTPAAMALAGFFALFHGYAHGGELGDAGAWPFMAGFAIATALLHATGVGVGIGLSRFAGSDVGWWAGRWPGQWIVRGLGGLTALGGLWIVVGS